MRAQAHLHKGFRIRQTCGTEAIRTLILLHGFPSLRIPPSCGLPLKITRVNQSLLNLIRAVRTYSKSCYMPDGISGSSPVCIPA